MIGSSSTLCGAEKWFGFGAGNTGNRKHARRELEPLASRYTCIVFDQRGHGESTPIYDPARYEPDAMSRDLESVLDALKIDRAIIAGESMGAAVALIFALRAPDRIEKLFLLAPRIWAQGPIPIEST